MIHPKFVLAALVIGCTTETIANDAGHADSATHDAAHSDVATHDGHLANDAAADAHEHNFADCAAIIAACHGVDPGTGPIHDCHEIGHDATTNATCAAERTRCVAVCTADASVADAAHASDAAAADAAHHH